MSGELHSIWQYNGAVNQWAEIPTVRTEDASIAAMDRLRLFKMPGVVYVTRPVGWRPSQSDVVVVRKQRHAVQSLEFQRRGA